MLFCPLLIFFSKSTFAKNSFRNTIRVSNSLDPDQARHYAGPDLVSNCLQKLSADNATRGKELVGVEIHGAQKKSNGRNYQPSKCQ